MEGISLSNVFRLFEMGEKSKAKNKRLVEIVDKYKKNQVITGSFAFGGQLTSSLKMCVALGGALA